MRAVRRSQQAPQTRPVRRFNASKVAVEQKSCNRNLGTEIYRNLRTEILGGKRRGCFSQPSQGCLRYILARTDKQVIFFDYY